MITGLLKIGIQGQIQGVACLRLCPGRNLKRSSEVVDIDRFRSLSSLKIRLHLFFKADFADNVGGVIACVLLFQFLQFFRGNQSCITDDRSKVQSIIVDSLIILRNIDSEQGTGILKKLGNRLLLYVSGQCDGIVPLVGVCLQG